ncbi:MAG: cytochrome c biogenesis protein CcsA [Saprospiraceae bacterium]
MQPISYLGEHLWVQHLGYAFLILAFLSAIYTALISIRSYYVQSDWIPIFEKWRKYGLIIHQISLIGVIGMILFMMSSHFFEFHYVWEHVSDDLPKKYILSAFWEGQEGSFLLWMFWNTILCWLLVNHKNYFTWMNIAIIMLVQAVLMSMILGIYFFGYRIGSNPFLLLRETMDIPLFNNPNYVSLVKGNGLNPLLQNYWMLIHPPTLFLGFASTVVPFAYALSGLITKKHKEWLRPCLKWSLFSGSILGLGILMGGIWAYEALSFGGYWAWDPVENMSLVPWLVLIAGIHSHMIAQATNYSIKATVLFYFITYSLVIYSTYLTRSGVLGDTSVHAFTGLGLGWQLVAFIFASVLIPLYFLFRERKQIPVIKEEENLASREFWMFIGSLILLFSAILITFTTSIPVYNKILDFVSSSLSIDLSSYHRSAPVDVIAHHNKFQLWISVIIAILSGFTLYLRYLGNKLTGVKKGVLISLLIIVSISAVFTAIIGAQLHRTNYPIYLLLFSSLFSICANLWYLIQTYKLDPKVRSASLAHIGFGVLLLGILFTGLNRRNIVPNKFFQEEEFFDVNKDNLDKHFLLFKNEPKFAQGYWMNYVHDTLEGRFRKYNIELLRVDSLNNTQEKFNLHPDIQYDNRMTKVAAANPYIRHYWNKDLFSLIAQIPIVQMDVESANKAEDSLQYVLYNLKLNDTVFGRKHYFVLREIKSDFTSKDIASSSDDLGIQIKIEVGDETDTVKSVLTPGIIFKSNLAYRFPFEHEKLGIRSEISDTLIYSIANEAEKLQARKFSIKEKESITTQDGISFKLMGFDRNPSIANYIPQSGDIAVGARLEVKINDKVHELMPVYLIRDSRAIQLPYISYTKGISINLNHIDPQNGVMDFEYNILKIPETIPVRIAENAPRTDYLVMEIIEFPGIIMVWTGSLLMVFGLAMASYFRRKL